MKPGRKWKSCSASGTNLNAENRGRTVNAVTRIITDQTLTERLEAWARWCKTGGACANLGYPSMSIEQTANQGQAQKRAIIFDTEMEIEELVSRMHVSQPVHADVIRQEYGACRGSYDPGYDEYTESGQQYSADRLNLSINKYRQLLREAREMIRFGLS